MKPYKNNTYVIIPTSEVENVDFTQVEQTSPNTLRFSINGGYVLLKFISDTPSFEGKTQYSHAEIKVILKDSRGIWYVDEESAVGFTTRISNFIQSITWSNFNPFN